MNTSVRPSAKKIYSRVLGNLKLVSNYKEIGKFRAFKTAVILLLFIFFNTLNTSNVSAQVTTLQDWSSPALYNSTAATQQNLLYSVVAGSNSNRLLVVAIATSQTANGSRSVTLTYGGKALTAVSGDMSITGIRQHTVLYYLNEAGLDAATNTTLAATVSGGTTRVTTVWAAVFDYVDQTTPINNSQNYNNNNTANSSFSFSTALSVGAGDQGVLVIGSLRSANTGARTINYPTNWTNIDEETFTTTDGVRSGVLNRSIPSTTASDNCASTLSGNAFASMTGMVINGCTQPTVSAGTALSAICRGVTSAALGGSTGGSATGGTWSDGGAGGTFSPNATTLNATYTPASTFSGTITLTLTSSGGSCGIAAGSKTLVVRPAFASGAIATTGETICYGGTPLSTIGSSTAASGGDNIITYSWRSSADGYIAAIAGATIATFLPPTGLTATTSYRRYAKDNTCNTTPTVSTDTWTVTVNPISTLSLSSGSSNQSPCINTAITTISYSIGGAATGATITAGALPAGVAGSFASGIFTIAGTPSVSGTFNYTVTATGNCAQSLSGTITVKPDADIVLSSSAATDGQTVCRDNPILNITYALSSSVTGVAPLNLPPGVTGSYNAGTHIYTVSGIPNTTGNYEYTLTATGACVSASIDGAIYVSPSSSLSLTSANNTQTLCINTAIATITYSIGGNATGATVSGLPAGVTGLFNGGIFTISGISTIAGTYNYSVTTISPCVPLTLTGQIVVQANPTITLSSAAGTNAQTVCINTAITNIAFQLTGTAATGAIVTGLPAGIIPSYNATTKVFTLSGSPTVSGTFNYTVSTSGPCAVSSTTGSLTVRPSTTISLSSGTASQTICINNALTSFSYTITNATGAGVAGLPAGVTGSYAAGVFTIIGTPTASGTFTYTITTTGSNCINATATGIITVNGNTSISLTSGAGTNNSTKCINALLTNITFSLTNATGASVTGLPAGVNGNLVGSIFTISGTPTVSGSFPYTVTATGSCTNATATGTITVNPLTTIALTAGTASQTKCINTALTSFSYTIANATGATTSSLPAGVTGSYAAGVYTISGTPTASGTFNYTVTTSGGICNIPTATGTITVNPATAISLTTANNIQSVCNNSAISNIAYSIANGIASVSGLPTGVTGNLIGNVYTLNGTPSVAGSYPYTVTVVGICNTVTATGTITVNPLPTVFVSADYCVVPGKVRLSSIPSPVGTYNYIWSNGGTTSYIDVDISAIYTVTVTNTNGCKATGNLQVATELVVNGDFSLGNVGFTSPASGANQYRYQADVANNVELFPEGLYGIGPNANTYHTNFWGKDHTTPGTGNFMIVNGFPGSPQPIIWNQTVDVLPNTNYYFSAWAMSLNSVSPFAQLKFSVNGISVGTTAVLSTHGQTAISPDNWVRFYATWNSGSATSAVCSIIDLQTAPGGNDFGLDDISISSLSPFISIISPPASDTQTVCINNPIQNIIFNVGSGGTGPIIAALPPGLTYAYNGVRLTVSGSPTSLGDYSTTITTDGACDPVTYNVFIRVKGQTIDLSTPLATKTQTICLGSVITDIKYATAGNVTGVTVTGLPAGVTTSYIAKVLTISGTPTGPAGTYNYSITTTGDTCSSATATGTIVINQPKVAPTALVATPSTVCLGSSTVLSQSGGILGTGATWKWYSNNTYTTLVGTGVGANASITVSPAVNTTYYLRAEGGASPCSVANLNGPAAGITVAVRTVSANPLAAEADPLTVCGGSESTLSLLGGGIPGETIAWYTGSCGGTLVGTGNNLAVFPTTTTTYYGRYQSGSPCNFNTACVSVTVEVTAAGTWLGTESGYWNDPENWCGGVPTANTSVIIPANTDYFPVISSSTGAATVKNIVFLPGAELYIEGETLKIAGSIVSNGSINAVNGTIEMFGTTGAQNISGSMFASKIIQHLKISNSNGVNITGTNDTVKVTYLLDFGKDNAVLNPNGKLTLVSSLNATASVGKMNQYVGNRIVGNVTVERYIPNHAKAWQLLAAPTVGQSIKAAWQEGNAPLSNTVGGFGTIITSNLGGSTAGTNALGFDIYTPTGPTLKKYNDATNLWDGVASTNQLINNNNGYMILVRGDRSVTAYNQAATSLKLRTSGQLYTPLDNAPATMNVKDSGFQSIGNPYASAIDFSKLIRTGGVQDLFYLWDPKLTSSDYSPYGLGGYQCFIRDGAGYRVIPGGGSYTSGNTNIESGLAFLVSSTNGGGTLAFTEDAKTTGSNATFRENTPITRAGSNFSTNLSVMIGATPVLLDGVFSQYDDLYSNAIDKFDAIKAGSSVENISLLRENKKLVAERRSMISSRDTVFYVLNQLKRQTYQLSFNAENMEMGIEAILVDKYLNTSTNLDLINGAAISFVVNSDLTSSASDRFYVVFSILRNTLPPITISSAIRNSNSSVNVKWNTGNLTSYNTYFMEMSANGAEFKSIKIDVNASKNSAATESIYLDEHTSTTASYYRIKAIGKDGKSYYSNTAKVEVVNREEAIIVYPNPIVNKTAQVQFKNKLPGTYTVTIINSLGQVVYNNKIITNSISENKSISFFSIPSGSYYMNFKGSDGTQTVVRILIQ